MLAQYWHLRWPHDWGIFRDELLGALARRHYKTSLSVEGMSYECIKVLGDGCLSTSHTQKDQMDLLWLKDFTMRFPEWGFISRACLSDPINIQWHIPQKLCMCCLPKSGCSKILANSILVLVRKEQKCSLLVKERIWGDGLLHLTTLSSSLWSPNSAVQQVTYFNSWASFWFGHMRNPEWRLDILLPHETTYMTLWLDFPDFSLYYTPIKRTFRVLE